MESRVIYETKSLYRDAMRVTGFQFGKGEESVCIIGALRGNEIQQMYSCSQVIKVLKQLEKQGAIVEGKSILVIPVVNSYAMNIGKRFWPLDNTDINRMFPGYQFGETTQRVAAGVFEEIKDYKYGIQFASYYMPGLFTPHVRIMDTGYHDLDVAKKFGLPFIYFREPRPYDTTTLNYNWQIWNSHAFSLYGRETEAMDVKTTKEIVQAVLNFLTNIHVIRYRKHKEFQPRVISEKDLIPVKCQSPGMFFPSVNVQEEVEKGDVLGQVLDPYEGEVLETIVAPQSGEVFFLHNHPMVYTNTVVFKLIKF